MTADHPTPTYRSDMTVTLIDVMGDDAAVIQAMLVSTQGQTIDPVADYPRIRFLMKNRHGTPFEQADMKFYVEAPIFVFREWHRHRIGWSYNEMSGRYRELPPVFYLPHKDRALVQEGKAGAYTFVPGTPVQHHDTGDCLANSYEYAYRQYKYLLSIGIAKEVARACLPVATYSAMYAKCNLRSLMAFLSLRTKREGSTFPSYPQREIEMCAEMMEDAFAKFAPLTYRAFVECGRVCP